MVDLEIGVFLKRLGRIHKAILPAGNGDGEGSRHGGGPPRKWVVAGGMAKGKQTANTREARRHGRKLSPVRVHAARRSFGVHLTIMRRARGVATKIYKVVYNKYLRRWGSPV